jgi:superfamily II DNA or RNA helicase
MTLQQREYQNIAVSRTFEKWASGFRRLLLILPTGTGKTIVFARIAATLAEHGKRTLIMAHREELITQAVDKIRYATGCECGIEWADKRAHDDMENRIIVASKDSLVNRLDLYPHSHFDTIIVDEAHHALAETYQIILQHFDNAKVLGVTATPDRGDMRDLGEYFDATAYQYTMPEAIRDGYLSPIVAQTIPVQLDMTASQNYTDEEADEAITPWLEEIAQHIKDLCRMQRKTVIFLPLIKTSQRMKEILNDIGMVAEEVNGESPNRKEVLQAFDDGQYDVLCNAALLTEGWDCPSIDCVVCLRPTKIRSLYTQIVGRGTRIHPGKKDLLLLDFLWLTTRHDLVRPAHLVAPSADVAEAMQRHIENGGGDLQEILVTAEEEVLHEREKALVAELRKQRRKKGRLVDPLQYSMSIGSTEILDFTPVYPWEKEPVTDEQFDELESFGIYGELDNAGKAALLIDAAGERRAQQMASPKQIRFLEQRGFQRVGTWTGEQAGSMIGRIQMNNWRIPFGVRPAKYKP